MTQYLIPPTDDMIEAIARSIAKNRLLQDTSIEVNRIVGTLVTSEAAIDAAVDQIFADIWNGTTAQDEEQRERYREDARAAIRTINLKLITVG